jgi:hypothetical protein
VIFYEPKALYRAFREEVPEEEEIMPIGKSRIARKGTDLTMITYGAMIRPTMEAASELAEKDGVEAEVIDLLSLSPLDDELFTESVKKTGKAMIIHEAPMSYGPGLKSWPGWWKSLFITLKFLSNGSPAMISLFHCLAGKPLYTQCQPNPAYRKENDRWNEINHNRYGENCMAREFKMPDLGEGIHEGEILKVFVSEGDHVNEGDPLLEVETDKAAVEIPSPFTGIVEKILVKTGDMVKVGEMLITFEEKHESRTKKYLKSNARKHPLKAKTPKKKANPGKNTRI